MGSARRIVVLLAASECLYLALARHNAVNGARSVSIFLALLAALFLLYALAYRTVGGADDRRRLGLVALGAVLFRLTLLPAGLPPETPWSRIPARLLADLRGSAVVYEPFLLFDRDIWRYLWEGHAGAHGFSPYAFAPGSARLDPLADPGRAAPNDGLRIWSDVRDNVSYPAISSIYPPLLQGVFRLAHAGAPGSLVAIKLWAIGFDLLAALLIAATLRALGRPAGAALLYLWNPLVVKVFAGSGHLDSVLVAALAALIYCLARARLRLAGLAFALAVLAKFTPLLLGPWVWRRIGWWRTAVALGVIGAGLFWIHIAGAEPWNGFWTFARHWRFNAGPYALLEWLSGFWIPNPGAVASALSAIAVVGLMSVLLARDDGGPETFARHGAAALGALMLMSPVLMPWYTTWLLPFAIVGRQWLWVQLTAVVCAAFWVMVDEQERLWVLWIEYGWVALWIGQRYVLRRWPTLAPAGRPDLAGKGA